MTAHGKDWTISGESERAHIEISEDSQRQTVTWEWLQNNEWLPLCDHVATKL